MRLICYATSGEPPRIVPAMLERAWMDATPHAAAYRCLPLNIANAHGWMILNGAPFTAVWNGGARLEDVEVTPLTAGLPVLGASHFGVGVLTFHINGLFRTETGYDLMAVGPLNQPKDAIQPLAGVIETDWSPFSFTMNWKFTRPNTPVTFARNEPFCMIFPVERGLVERVEPEFQQIDANPELKKAYTAWSESRAGFIQGLKVPGSEALDQKWQKDYFQGSKKFAESPPDHKTKLRPKPFARFRHWREGSLLDQIEPEQIEANIVNRRRLVDGVFSASSDTVVLTPDMAADMAEDADAMDFGMRPDFVSSDERALLLRAARSLMPVGEDGELASPAAMFDRIDAEWPEAGALIRDLRQRVTDALARLYDLTSPLYTDAAIMERLPEGSWIDPHAVRANADGSPHPLATRAFASILFLSGEEDGGEIYFPRLDLMVKPKAGMLLSFTAGWHHEFGMTEVRRGEVVTLSLFHTFAAYMRNIDLHRTAQQDA